MKAVALHRRVSIAKSSRNFVVASCTETSNELGPPRTSRGLAGDKDNVGFSNRPSESLTGEAGLETLPCKSESTEKFGVISHVLSVYMLYLPSSAN